MQDGVYLLTALKYVTVLTARVTVPRPAVHQLICGEGGSEKAAWAPVSWFLVISAIRKIPFIQSGDRSAFLVCPASCFRPWPATLG